MPENHKLDEIPNLYTGETVFDLFQCECGYTASPFFFITSFVVGTDPGNGETKMGNLTLQCSRCKKEFKREEFKKMQERYRTGTLEKQRLPNGRIPIIHSCYPPGIDFAFKKACEDNHMSFEETVSCPKCGKDALPTWKRIKDDNYQTRYLYVRCQYCDYDETICKIIDDLI